MWVYVCVYARTHTLHTWGTRCEPRSRDKTLTPAGPEESRWTKSRYTYIHIICVQSTHVYVYAKSWDEILDKLLFPLTQFL